MSSPRISQKLAYGPMAAAEVVDMSRAFIFQKIATGELKSFRIGTRRLIYHDDLVAWLNSYRNGGATEGRP